jgi:hypothetical protein
MPNPICNPHEDELFSAIKTPEFNLDANDTREKKSRNFIAIILREREKGKEG